MSSPVTSVRTYAGVLVALLCLTALTTAVAYVDLGPWNNVAALGIALTKATLVALFFMHVRRSPRAIPLVVVSSAVWLLILFGLTFADVLTRGVQAGPY